MRERLNINKDKGSKEINKRAMVKDRMMDRRKKRKKMKK